jgi:ATP-dependent helicase/nuclease subunit B
MGVGPGTRIDDWLGAGGVVVTASERAARALERGFHQRRRAEGISAWPAPNIQTWLELARSVRETHAGDERLLLNSAQELLLWAGIIGRQSRLATAFEATRRRMAAMAVEAHERLCNYAPTYLDAKARNAWDLDSGAFSGWLAAFERACRESLALAASRVPFEAVHLLDKDPTARPPVLVVGFDRILPLQRAFFDAWGDWREASGDEQRRQAHFYAAGDEGAELDACARWCARHLANHPGERILVLSQQISIRRGAIERAFLRHLKSGADGPFEFSLGVPLGRVPLARVAHLLLQWLAGALPENELDWLFSTGLLAVDPSETFALHAYMRTLRQRGLARPTWTLEAFTNQQLGWHRLPAAWLRRMQRARLLLSSERDHRQNPLTWAALVPELLSVAGLPGDRPLSSAEFQVWRRWSHAIDTCGSLGFVGQRIGWPEFLAWLAHILEDTLFSPESSNAPIQIAGPAESAGLSADAIWFLGADEDAWPATGPRHPLLPLQVQHEAGMPHASPGQDWDIAASMTRRILSSAAIVQFSYARRTPNTENQPSRLISQLVSPPQPLPTPKPTESAGSPGTLSFTDGGRVPLASARIRGGSGILTTQSQCPFKAFAVSRLGAQSWEPTEFGLSASQRGLLLHEVMHAVWGGPPSGLRSLDDLLQCADVDAFVLDHVRRVFDEKLPDGVRDRMPRRYLDLEQTRLRRVLREWLDYEATRLPFTVVETESTRTILLAGQTIDLRLDRIDQLNDRSLLVVDYKTGDPSPNAWQLPRPDDVQLPLYACLGIDAPAGGLVFAKVRTGAAEFSGRVRDVRATLLTNPSANSLLTKIPLTDRQLADWKAYIEQLARDFVSGRADIDPSDYPRTCERCDLPALCRIHETRAEVDPAEASEEAGDE